MVDAIGIPEVVVVIMLGLTISSGLPINTKLTAGIGLVSIGCLLEASFFLIKKIWRK